MTTPSSGCHFPKDAERTLIPETLAPEFVAHENRSDFHSHERLLTPEDVARVLQIGRTKVYELLTYGDLRSVKIGKSRRIRRTDLDDFILNLTTKSNER